MTESYEMAANVRALRTRLESIMAEMFSLYSDVLRYSESADRGQIYIERLLNRAIEAPIEQQVEPSGVISDNIRLSYDSNTPCKARWGLTPRGSDRGEIGISSNTLHIAIDDPAGTGWFSMELFLSWAEIRTFRTMKIQVAASAVPRMACQAFIRLFSQDGQTHDISFQRFDLEETLAVQDIILNLDIPHDITFHPEARPILIFLLEPKVADIKIEFISLTSS